MKEDFELLKDLEGNIGHKLSKLPLLNKIITLEEIDIKSIYELNKLGLVSKRGQKGFSTDNAGNVTGIYLDGGITKTKYNYTTLGKFRQLSLLILSRTQIRDLLSLANLKNLRQLFLISTDIFDISFMSNLKYLSWFISLNNPIDDLYPLAQLDNLSVLTIYKSRHHNFNFLKNLHNLKALRIVNSNFSDISTIKNCKNLFYLALRNNKVSDISKIENFQEIVELDLSANQISDISSITNLTLVKRVDLSYNNITTIPINIMDLNLDILCEKSLSSIELKSGLNIYDNPIETPPIEIIKKGRKAVIEYFKSLEGEKEAINEVKVIFVGDGSSGKTSLVKQLLGENFNKSEPQTHGINIRNWIAKRNGNDITVHFWDFGGQEIMHATHQFFLSRRSLYILVLDGRKDEKTEYWLKHIESFGGDSPILVVLNKIDQNPAFDVNRKFLKEKYKGIKDFFRVSCATQHGINQFSIRLINELSSIEILKTTWAKSWFNVKSQLENMQHPFISFKEYNDLCLRENIIADSSKETLVEFLHDLGVIMHFSDIQLLDTHVLEPKWVTEAVYKIINSRELADGKGTLKVDLLNEILKKKDENDYYYPPDKYGFIIDLMMKFELCYGIDKHTILIPDLLEIQEPEYDFDYYNSLRFIIAYDFMPKSIMPRFMVRMHKDIIENLRWRTGVVLKDDDCNCMAVVKADEREKKIFIYVYGDRKRDYFSVIRRSFREISDIFEKLEVTELVPIPDQHNIFVEYDELIGHEISGKNEIFIGKIRKGYNVSGLLNGIEKERDRKQKYIEDRGSKIINIHDSDVTIGNKEEKVSKNIVNIGDGATFRGDFLVGNKIKDSFNKADSSQASDDLKELLKALAIEVGKIAEQYPEKAEQVANDLQSFTNEATSEKPRQKWWQLSAEGLKDAAKTVGEVGVSVLKTLEKITPILAKIL